MSSTWLRRFQKAIAAWLVFLGATHPLARAVAQPEVFYYLAVPSCPAKGECVSVACIKLDRNGLPVDAKQAKAAPFFSIWYSGSWQGKTPNASAKQGKPGKLADLPAPLVRFFAELEKLRATSVEPLIPQPLFKPPFSMRWEHVAHLNIVAAASAVSAEDRSKALIASFHEAIETDPAKSLMSNLSCLGVKPRSLRYWPEYNVFLIEADARFQETIETLFSPTD